MYVYTYECLQCMYVCMYMYEFEINLEMYDTFPGSLH